MRPAGQNRGAGFSLIELLAVMAVIAIIFSLAAMGVSVLRAHELAGVSDQVAGELAYALQVAAVRNEAVEMRFYENSDLVGDGPPRYRGYQLVTRDPETGEVLPLDRYRSFGGNIVLHPDEKFTTLLALPKQRLDDPRLTGAPADTESYVSFRLLPEGTTSLTPDLQWSLTLVFDSPLLDQGRLPENYRSVVINPVTGGVRVY